MSLRFKTHSRFDVMRLKQVPSFTKLIFCIFFMSCVLYPMISYVYAQEITIIFTGDTHAMLYPCLCPKEMDGGVARRATLIEQLRKNNPNTLVLDSGAFFAAGLRDQYTQNIQLDQQRTIVYLKAMELMGYDAVAISDEEFNFGNDFLAEHLRMIKLPFLSCNVNLDKVLPYIIKEIEDIKIGIIGVTHPYAKQKAQGLELLEPRSAVSQTVGELKRKGADIIILLSNLGETEDLNLIQQTEGIDVIVTGRARLKEVPYERVDSTLFLRPDWQGRRLGKATLIIKDKRILESKVEELRVSDKITDNRNVLYILPECFSDTDCRKEGYLGMCYEPGKMSSRCMFSEVNKVNLSIITSKSCIACDTDMLVTFLKAHLPGLKISYLYYPSGKAKRMVKKFDIKGFPAYLLGSEVEKEKAFIDLNLKNNALKKDSLYLLKPAFAGISYFINRQPIKGRVDLFVGLYDRYAEKLLEAIRDFNPPVHFLAIEEDGRFDAQGGNLEVEEYLRAVCIEKYHPEHFWDYIICRAKNSRSSWWDDCAVGLDADKIKTCAKSPEAGVLLKENISLNKELSIMFGPVYLMDNQQIFSTKGTPTKEEFEKIFKR